MKITWKVNDFSEMCHVQDTLFENGTIGSGKHGLTVGKFYKVQS